MSTVVVDASVAVVWVAPEPGHDAWVSLRDDPNILLAPELMLVEFSNVLWRKAERGEFDPSFMDRALEDLRVFDIAWSPDADLLADAMRMALHHHHPVYDCLYLALAKRERALLATMDRRMAVVARRIDPPIELWKARSI